MLFGIFHTLFQHGGRYDETSPVGDRAPEICLVFLEVKGDGIVIYDFPAVPVDRGGVVFSYQLVEIKLDGCRVEGGSIMEFDALS